jgi:FkbM family methyltransferase
MKVLSRALDKSRFLLAGITPFRVLALSLLKTLSRDVRVKNPWTQQRMVLNLYKHKGYWFHRRGRERQVMNWFKELVKPGDRVVEVGAHIGFISQYLSYLVGEKGEVIAFEPSDANLEYLYKNCKDLRNVKIEPMAVGKTNGYQTLWKDTLTGQNSSLLADYFGFDATNSSHRFEGVKEELVVQTVTLDSYLESFNSPINGLKVDIEGYEYFALLGMKNALKEIDWLIIEVTSNQSEVIGLLINEGFYLLDESMKDITALNQTFSGNILAKKISKIQIGDESEVKIL